MSSRDADTVSCTFGRYWTSLGVSNYWTYFLFELYVTFFFKEVNLFGVTVISGKFYSLGESWISSMLGEDTLLSNFVSLALITYKCLSICYGVQSGVKAADDTVRVFGASTTTSTSWASSIYSKANGYTLGESCYYSLWLKWRSEVFFNRTLWLESS